MDSVAIATLDRGIAMSAYDALDDYLENIVKLLNGIEYEVHKRNVDLWRIREICQLQVSEDKLYAHGIKDILAITDKYDTNLA